MCCDQGEEDWMKEMAKKGLVGWEERWKLTGSGKARGEGDSRK